MDLSGGDAKRFNLLVTVGSTEFEDLIRTFDNEEVGKVIRQSGITGVVFQIGRGVSRPREAVLLEDGTDIWCQLETHAKAQPRLGFVRFVVNYREMMEKADVVVTHGGAGTMMELIELGKPALAISNPALLENHQVELCEAMQEEGVCGFFDGTRLKDHPEEFADTLKAFLEGMSASSNHTKEKILKGLAFWRDAAKSIHDAIAEEFEKDLFDNEGPLFG